jgi:hypothetical protein
MEYQVIKSFLLRVGFLSDPLSVTFGAGLIFGRLETDISSEYNLVLGYSPRVSVQYRFGK